MGQCNEWFTSRQRFTTIVISHKTYVQMTWCNAVNRIVRFISLLTMQSYSNILSGIVFYKQELIL